MTDFKAFLRKLYENLNILYEREAKYGGNAPLELLNQIEDHKEAIRLTELAIEGEIGEIEWQEALKPLLLFSLDINIGSKYINYQPPVSSALFYNVPPLPNTFVGRNNLLNDIVDRLLSRDALALSTEGIPGAGKTALAIAVAHDPRVLNHFTDGVLWAGLGLQPDVMSILSDWADALKIDLTNKLTEQARLQTVCNAIGRARYLLVIDDAWEIASARLLHCGAPNCSYLLTTRDKKIAREFAGRTRTVAVPELSPNVAFDLISQLAPEAGATNPAAVRELLEAVGYLPLAIELLGGYLAETLFFRESQTAAGKLKDPAVRLQMAQERLGSHTKGKEVTLAETIKLSLSDLPAVTVEVFYALGAFAAKPATFDLEAALAGVQVDRSLMESEIVESHLKHLVFRNLLQWDGNCFTIHQAIADFARTDMDDKSQVRHRDYYLNEVNKDRENWKYIETLYAQFKHAWTNAPEDKSRLSLIWAIYPYQRRRGLWQDQLSWSQAGLGLADGLEKGMLLNNIGSIYQALGEFKRALDHYQNALSIMEEHSDWDSLIPLLNEIGKIHVILGDQWEALEYYHRALPITEKVGDRTQLAATLTNISEVYILLNLPKRALDYYQRVLPIVEEIGDPVTLANTLTKMGQVYLILDNQKEALNYYRRAVPIVEETGDRDHLVTTLTNIGQIYDSIGFRKQALEYYERTIPIRKEITDPAELATILNNIGSAYQSLYDYQKALSYFQQSLAIHEKIGNESSRANSLNNIGTVYWSLGWKNRAFYYLERALHIWQKLDDQSGVATSLANIGVFHNSSGDHQRALKYLQQALPIREAMGDQAGLASVFQNMGRAYHDLGNYNKALDYYQRALSIRQKIGHRFGESITRYNMAALYRAKGQLEQAVAQMQLVVQYKREVQHPDLKRDQAILAKFETELRAKQVR